MTTTGHIRRLEPFYKQHEALDDLCGVMLDVEVTTGDVTEGKVALECLNATAEITGVAQDRGRRRRLRLRQAVRRTGAAGGRGRHPAKPMRRFRHDAKRGILKCPRGKIQRPGRRLHHGRFLTSRAADCKPCGFASLCLSKGRVN